MEVQPIQSFFQKVIKAIGLPSTENFKAKVYLIFYEPFGEEVMTLGGGHLIGSGSCGIML